MQQLHLVGYTTDHDSLIFSTRKGAKSGSFVLPLDERLLATIGDAVRRRLADGEELDVPAEVLAPSAAPRRQSLLSPREIQDRLRAGRSLEEIATIAGVGEEWVARFAAPVEAERLQVVGRARGLVYAKPRRGESGELLGLSVRWNLADRGVRLTNDEFDDGWSAYQVADHAWMVTFTFESRKRMQEAEWEVDLASGDLVGRNRLASDLGYIEPGRRRRSMASLQPTTLRGSKGGRGTAARPPDAPDPADEEAEADSTARPMKASTSPPPSKRAAPKRAAPKRPAPKRPVAKRAALAKRASTSKTTTKRAVPTPRAATVKRGSTAKRNAPSRSASPRSALSKASKGSKAAKVATKRAPAKRAAPRPASRKAAPAARPATKKASAKKPGAPARGAGRGAPPTSAIVAPEERAALNELGQRRLQLVSGAPIRATGVGYANRASAPAPVAANRRPMAPPSLARPAPVRISAARSVDVVRSVIQPKDSAAKAEVAVAARPARPDPALDVTDDEAVAESRRAERRAARAARSAEPAMGAAGGTDGVDVPAGDGRVVTIRANRATPPTVDDDVIVAERSPLRAARPATRPPRRRFGRTER